MADWTDDATLIAALAAGKAYTDEKAQAQVENPVAIAEGATGAPRIRLAALENLAAGTSVRTNQTGPFVVSGNTFTAATGWAFIQSGTIRISVRHFQSGGNNSEVRIQRVRGGTTTTLTTLSTGTGSPGATQTYDADVLAGDVILLQNRNTNAASSSTINIVELQVDAAVSLWPTGDAGAGTVATYGLVQGNP
jgi:hypothetical protein